MTTKSGDSVRDLLAVDEMMLREAGCYYEHCNARCISWTTPMAAFALNATVYGVASAITDYVRRILDKRGVSDLAGFAYYLVIIMSLMFGLHTLFYYTLGWGGSSLATPNQIECANTEFFVTGRTDHCDDDKNPADKVGATSRVASLVRSLPASTPIHRKPPRAAWADTVM
jgi:hypothetical protein